MLKKFIVSTLFCCISFSAYSEQQHHDLTIITCRALPSGDLQIVGLSKADHEARKINFSATTFKEKVLDRYLSLCLTSHARGAKLGIDYLECTGTACVTTTSTSLNSY